MALKRMLSGLDRPIELLPLFRDRVWGRDNLAPWFSVIPRYGGIGEVWFSFEENLTSLGKPLGELIRDHPEMLGMAGDAEHPGICPLLVKLLFTSERLSVQVHPDDAYAQQHHQSLGKTEAWYVLDAQPPGEVAIGFREEITRERFEEAAQSGEIDRLLDWRKVSAGETIFVPAGTVHAIGAGLTLCEIQENSDITYRLYDYGRGRELHLEDGAAVARLGRAGGGTKRIALADGREELLECAYFRMERLRPKQRMRIPGGLAYYLLLLCVKGSGELAGEPFRAGQAWLIPAQGAEVAVNGAESEWILTYTADEPVAGIEYLCQR